MPLMRSTGWDGPIEPVATQCANLVPTSGLTFGQPVGRLVAPALPDLWRQRGRDGTHDQTRAPRTSDRLDNRTSETWPPTQVADGPAAPRWA